MNDRSGLAASMLLALALVASAPAEAAKAKAKGSKHPKSWTWTFQADTLGQAPINTVTFGGTWKVVADSTLAPSDSVPAAADTSGAAGSAPVWPRVLRQTESDDGIRFHYVQFTKPVLGDLAVSVRFRILEGEMDPSAGVMFSLHPKGKNGYIVRVSGDREELVAHYILSGKRRDLKYAKIDPLEPGAWHTLDVERNGSMIIARYDGVERIRIRDERFTFGSIGLWTEDDTVVDFAGLTLTVK